MAIVNCVENVVFHVPSMSLVGVSFPLSEMMLPVKSVGFWSEVKLSKKPEKYSAPPNEATIMITGII